MGFLNENGLRKLWEIIKGKFIAKESGKGLSTNDYTTAEKEKLTGIAAGAEVNVQSDWNQTDTTKDDYIKNKPTLGTAAEKDYTNSVTSGSTDLVTSGAVWTAIDNLPEPMVFKGTLGTGGTISELPAATAGNQGYTYKVITAGTYARIEANVGDVFTSTGTEWVLIPAGDSDSDTWRAINVNGTQLLGDAISTGAVNFKNGSNVTITGSGNDITISASQPIKVLKTDNTTAQTTSASESIGGSGTINLHKISKTGNYDDLINKPTSITDEEIEDICQ